MHVIWLTSVSIKGESVEKGYSQIFSYPPTYFKVSQFPCDIRVEEYAKGLQTKKLDTDTAVASLTCINPPGTERYSFVFHHSVSWHSFVSSNCHAFLLFLLPGCYNCMSHVFVVWWNNKRQMQRMYRSSTLLIYLHRSSVYKKMYFIWYIKCVFTISIEDSIICTGDGVENTVF